MRARLAALPRPALVAAVVVLVVLVVAAVAVAMTRGREPVARPTAGGTAATATPSAGADGTPGADASASVDPTAASGAVPAPPAEPEADPAAPYEPTAEPAVPLEATATFADGVTARLVTLEPVQGEAEGPGEVAGPAVRVTVELANGTGRTLSLGTTVVNAFAGQDAVPSEPLSGPGAQPFSGALAPGGVATAVYVFGVPEAARDRLQVTVSHDPRVTSVLFEGAAPRS